MIGHGFGSEYDDVFGKDQAQIPSPKYCMKVVLARTSVCALPKFYLSILSHLYQKYHPVDQKFDERLEHPWTFIKSFIILSAVCPARL